MKQTDGNIWNNTDELLKHVESKTERRWNDHTLPSAIPKFQHSTCRRRRKCFLEEGDAGDREEDDVRRRRLLGSRVDAPQKPNCRSPEQGPERQRLRRHLPSRFSVRVELRDEESHRATELFSGIREFSILTGVGRLAGKTKRLQKHAPGRPRDFGRSRVRSS